MPAGADDKTKAEVIAHRDGSVGVHFWASWASDSDAMVVVDDGHHLRAAADAAFAALRLQGATGRARYVFSLQRRWGPIAKDADAIGRWWDTAAAPSGEEIASIARDLHRTAEEVVPEP
jgi:hypothetical protein